MVLQILTLLPPGSSVIEGHLLRACLVRWQLSCRALVSMRCWGSLIPWPVTQCSTGIGFHLLVENVHGTLVVVPAIFHHICVWISWVVFNLNA